MALPPRVLAPTKYTDAGTLRRLFNEAAILEKVAAGKLAVRTLKSKKPVPPIHFEPFCTKSELVSYRDTFDREIAQAHQYKRKDGTIGASGLPDPKRVLVDGVLWCDEKELADDG